MTMIERFLENPFYPFSHFFYAGWLNWIPDRIALKIWYRSIFNQKLNLDNPRTYNEKIQWLKLYDRNPLYPTIVNKKTAKDYVAQKIGSQYIIPTIAVYDSVEELDLSTLPNQFVLKCTHDSGGVIICRNKEKLNFDEAKQKLKKSLSYNFYYAGREWPYKQVKPQIIVEKYMEDKCGNNSLRDYKFFCFNGVVKCLYVSEGSHTPEQKLQFFDTNYSPMDCRRKDYKQFEILPEKPKQFQKMLKLSEILSKGFPHVRIDLYEINGDVYFGEMTLYTSSGFIPFECKEDDEMLGSWLELPQKNK